MKAGGPCSFAKQTLEVTSVGRPNADERSSKLELIKKRGVSSLANAPFPTLGFRSNARESASSSTEAGNTRIDSVDRGLLHAGSQGFHLFVSFFFELDLSIDSNIILVAGHPCGLNQSPFLLASDFNEWAMAFGLHTRNPVNSSRRHWACP
jgi:hypothetical protein